MNPTTAILLLASALPLPASVLMVDFGPDPVASGQELNSPYHTANPSFTSTTWNSRGVADVASGLLYADGSAATGIAYNLGHGTAASGGDPTVINLASNPATSGSLGGELTTGVYAAGAPGRDAIYQGSSGQTRNLGMQVTGLAPGIYEIFVAARNTSSTSNYTQTIYVGLGAAGTNYDFDAGGYQSAALSYTSGNASSTWVQEGSSGENYARFQIEITPGQALNIAVQGDAEQTRGFLNLVQIVQIPEPSTALLAIAGILPVFCRRRRTV